MIIKDRFNQIARITSPTRQIFEEEFLLRKKPVIITDLFHDQPIQEINSINDIRQKLGEISILISEGFRPHLFTSQICLDHKPLDNNSCTINQYLDLINQKPDAFELCNENELPDQIQALIETPEYCLFGSIPDDSISRLFIGNAGNYAHLHFDGDFRQVLFYQVVGSKRIILFPPESAPKLVPHHHWSLVCLEHFTESEKDAFVAYAGGMQCVLNPGETIFFPSAVWHYVEYLTTGMSIALRFGRNGYTQFLSEKLHKDSFIQRIASRMIDEGVVQADYKAVYDLLEKAYNQPANSVSEKIQQMSAAYQQAWFLMSNETDPIYQIPTTEFLNRSMSVVDNVLYQSTIRPATQCGGWDWLPSANKVGERT
jgi:lysine-specific demethylase 8